MKMTTEKSFLPENANYRVKIPISTRKTPGFGGDKGQVGQ